MDFFFCCWGNRVLCRIELWLLTLFNNFIVLVVSRSCSTTWAEKGGYVNSVILSSFIPYLLLFCVHSSSVAIATTHTFFVSLPKTQRHTQKTKHFIYTITILLLQHQFHHVSVSRSYLLFFSFFFSPFSSNSTLFPYSPFISITKWARCCFCSLRFLPLQAQQRSLHSRWSLQGVLFLFFQPWSSWGCCWI